MRKTLYTYLFIFLVSPITVLADMAATITCTGKNVVLRTETPYLGEHYAQDWQTLYILESIDNKDQRVFFLDVEPETDVDRNAMIYTSGKNKQGGSFLLKHTFWKDNGDGTIINETASGVLTYSHGPLVGNDEPVVCVKN